MREFMTKVSDYLSEWREDPEREEGQFPRIFLVGIGIVAVAAIVLLLWWGHGVQERKREEAAQKARELQEAQAIQEEQNALALQEAQGLVATTYEEKMQEYMSRDSGEKMRQEYLTNTSELEEKVRELQSALEQVRREVAEIAREYRDNSSSSEKVTEKLTVLEKETRTVMENVKTLESRLENLTEVVQRIEREKISVIQGQIAELKAELGQIRTDVSGVHEKIKELRKEEIGRASCRERV